MTLRLAIIGIIALAIIGVAGYVIHRERQDAAEEALEKVRKNNETLGRAAEGGALEYDDCRRAGRLWDYGRDRCGGVAPRSGD
jgi:hypothetical protein